MYDKTRNEGKGGGIFTTSFYGRALFTSPPSWRGLISMEKSSHFAFLAELLDGHFYSIF
jgi:hypothetical protein